MRPDFRLTRSSRRSAAVGLWSLLVVSIGLAATKLPFGLSVFLVAVVSCGCSTALMLIGSEPQQDRRLKSRQKRIALGLSLAISAAWAVLCGWHFSISAAALILTVGILPVLAASQLTFPQSRSLWNIDLSADLPMPKVTNAQTTSQATQLKSDPSSEAIMQHDETSGSSVLESDLLSIEEEFEPETEVPLSSNVTQWMTRSLTDQGDVIEGGVRIEFADGQRDVTVHLSFCPPFRDIPEIMTEDLDGCDLEIRVAASFPFGARMTVRRPAKNLSRGTLNTETHRIGFVAIAQPVRRAA